MLKEVAFGANHDHSQASIELLSEDERESHKSMCFNEHNDEIDIMDEDM